MEVQGFERNTITGTTTKKNTETGQGRSEGVNHGIGAITMVDLDRSLVSTHMETEAQEDGDDGGMDHAGSGGSFSQPQNSDALIGGINDNNNAETVTLGQNDT